MVNINILSSVVLVLLVFYILFMIKQPEHIRERVLKIQLTPVIGYNIVIHIVQWGKLPVEFSTINYFIVPIIVMFGIKKLDVWAVYAAMMAGFFYYFSMIIDGNDIYGHFPPYSVYTSVYNHGALLSFAFIKMATHQYKRNERLILWGGLIFCIIWALSLESFVNPVVQPGRIFIYEILYAYLIRYDLPSTIPWGYVIYYIGLFLFLESSTRFVFWINKALLKKRGLLQN